MYKRPMNDYWSCIYPHIQLPLSGESRTRNTPLVFTLLRFLLEYNNNSVHPMPAFVAVDCKSNIY